MAAHRDHAPEKAAADGLATLDSGTQVPLAQLRDMVGATGGANGERGQVPQPTLGQQAFVLLGSAVWTDPAAVEAGAETQVVSASGSATETSLTYVLVPGMTITPGAGTYLVLGRMPGSHNKNGQQVLASVFANGVEVTYAESQVGGQANNIGSLTPMAVATVADAQTIEIHWRNTSTAGGGQVSTQGQRSLILLKVGS